MKKLLILLVAAAATAISAQIAPDRKLATVQRLIETFYVGDIDTTAVVEQAIKAMLKTLDPHSAYADADETKALTEPLEGNFSGIGIQFQMLNDSLYVIQTTSGGPSEAAGLLAGDRILSAGDSVISGAKRQNASIIKILRGPKGTVVDLKVKRPGVAEPINFTITRDDIPIHSVDAAYMPAPGTGYIRLSHFGEDTPKEFEQAVRDLTKQGMRDLIIDLQGNGGGYLGAATAIADMLLEPGSLIVYTDGDRTEPHRYIAQKKPLLNPECRVVVLMDQYSASASEILAGAIQDNDRGVIVGRRSFGKGLVQRPFPFPDGTMVKLTVAHYYSPSGRCVQKPYKRSKDGDGIDAYNHDLLNRYNKGEYFHRDSMLATADSSKVYRTLRLGRTVLGGGGIFPDRFVAVDTSAFTPYFRDLRAKSLFPRVAATYIDAHRDSLKRSYPTEQAFLDGFTPDDNLIGSLTMMGSQEGVPLNEEQLQTSMPMITNLLKSLVGRDLFSQETLFKVINATDATLIEALEILAPHSSQYDQLLSSPAQ